MKITDLKVLRGPNYWSDRYNELIALTIDKDQVSRKTNEIKNFSENLKSILPSLYESKKDFSSQMESGLPVEEVIVLVAKELQILAGMECEYVNIYMTEGQNNFHVIFSYTVEEAGIYAGETAVRIVNILSEENSYKDIQYDIDDLIHIKFRYSVGPTAGYLLSEIKKRKIPYRQFNKGSLLFLGYGIRQKKMRTAITDRTSGLGMEIASDKEETKILLSDAHIPVPNGILVSSEDELRERISEVKFPLVIKPFNGNHGRGITTDINTLEAAVFGFNLASSVSRNVIIEEFIKGDDYRFLVVDYKLVAVTKRTPPFITGDGISTIGRLIDKENNNSDRGEGPEYVLTLIKIDVVTKKILNDKKLTLDSILQKGEVLILKETANISTGGIATDVTDTVHPENKFLAERIACMFNLDICGIDVMATTVEEPIVHGRGAIIEVNAGPGLRMHSNPQKGSSQNVAGRVADMLFPNVDLSLIPVVSLSDFQGASKIARLISHLIKEAGFKPGCNTSEGIYIQGHLTYKGDSTDYENVQEVLFDPTIDFAVVQCSDRSIARSGLGFNKCDVCIVGKEKPTPHNGHPANESRLQLIKVLVNSVLSNGYLIIDADQDDVYNLFAKAKNNIVLYSSDQNNERIQQHCSRNGIAAVISNGELRICNGEESFPIIETKNIILGQNETMESAVKYMLPAVLCAFVKDVPLLTIREGVLSFSLTPAHEKNLVA